MNDQSIDLFPRALRVVMVKRGITQPALARQIGVSQATTSNILLLKRTGYETRRKIVEHFGMNWDEFLDEGEIAVSKQADEWTITNSQIQLIATLQETLDHCRDEINFLREMLKTAWGVGKPNEN